MRTALRRSSAPLLKALADPVRTEICDLLSREELCVCHLVDELGISQPLLSHHLKVLRAAGLVEPRRHSYWTYYRLAPAGLEEVAGGLLDLAERGGRVTKARPCCA